MIWQLQKLSESIGRTKPFLSRLAPSGINEGFCQAAFGAAMNFDRRLDHRPAA
jgi:hypothetical protein